MNPTQSLMLTRMVRAICPQQKFDEYTPDAWHKLLEDMPFADCEQAVINVGRRQTFISPAEIRAEARKIRSDRIDRTLDEMPDVDDPDDIAGYLAALRAQRTRVADGTEKARPVAALLEAASRNKQIPAS